MKNTKDVNEDDVNNSIASLRAVQQTALEMLRRIVARVEASRADVDSGPPCHTSEDDEVASLRTSAERVRAMSKAAPELPNGRVT